MQIDGHHGMTYVVARYAGFDHEAAQTLAHASQYIDDATNGGPIKFENGALYNRIATAHKMLDYRNSEELANHRCWVPFHFLPGNDGLPVNQEPPKAQDHFVYKLVCKPDSHVARDMLRAAIRDKEKAYGFHRFGITMHVYADTFAHQGFAGINHKINDVVLQQTEGYEGVFERFKNKITNYFISEAFPLGHGAALTLPDQPYLTWSYKNGLGETVSRNNLDIFTEAADKMCRAMQCFIAGDKTATLENQQGLPQDARQVIREFLESNSDEDGEKRHEKWLEAISAGHFSFGAETVSYIPKGEGSWKHDALGTVAVEGDEDPFPFKPEFLTSNWKMFHDGALAHRFDVLHDILPKYGICDA
ncbi:MAG TPA: DUF6765 family protein [Anaerolineales bacterium]|nr:DUF6765 family protein [Anaerolineales bacterium]